MSISKHSVTAQSSGNDDSEYKYNKKPQQQQQND